MDISLCWFQGVVLRHVWALVGVWLSIACVAVYISCHGIASRTTGHSPRCFVSFGVQLSHCAACLLAWLRATVV